MPEPNSDSELEALYYDACSKHQQGLLGDARAKLESIIRAAPKHVDALHLLGIIAAQMQEYRLSVDLIAKAVELDSANAGFHSNLGFAFKNLMQIEAAIQCYDRAIAIQPNYAEAHYNRGVSNQSLERLDEAIDDYSRAIAVRPNYTEAYCNRGIALQKLGRHQAAVASYDLAIAIRPTYALAWSNRGLALQELHQLNEAVASCDRAIALMPGLAEAHYNRGIALKEMNQLEAAVASYDRAIAIKSDYAQAHYNRGNALKELKQLDLAVDSYDRAIQLRPNDVEANWNKGLALLLNGDFDKGLELYEWRWRKDGARSPSVRFAKPLWTGAQAIENKSILVWSEQGLGDTIQFCRYLRKLNEMGATVLFSPQKPLRGIVKNLVGPIQVVSEDESDLEFDFHVPLLSLPLAFKANLKNIPEALPYQSEDNEQLAHWKKAIGTEGFKIGISWQGADSGVAAGRSFEVKHFVGISKIEGLRLISLQKGAGAGQLTDTSLVTRVETLGDSFDSGPDAFMDTAAVMQLCDLVITSDTAIAHLAGTLRVPVWVVLKFVPDWRWLLDRNDSPWYPTMRLFRQKFAGDWKGTFTEIEKEIRRTKQIGTMSFSETNR